MDDVWQAPGPGSWMRDDVHFTGAMSGYLAALFMPAFAEGWRQGFARYGLPLESLQPAVVGGRMFARVQPVGAPEPKPGKTSSPPPKLVMRVLFAVHPELRRRRKSAAETLASKRWRSDRAIWREQDGPALRARCIELQAVDPDKLDDAALRDHLAALERLFHDGNVIHFRQNPASGIPVGDFVVHTTEWAGVEAAEATAALQGHSPASARCLELLDVVASAVSPVPGLAASLADQTVSPRSRLAELRESSPAAAAALDDYRAEYGQRIVTGFDVTDHTLAELPDVVVNSILARLCPPATDPVQAGNAAADALRERVPEQHRAAFDELLDEARAGYALHDEDVGYAFTWPLGLIRRALLVAGARLADRGALELPAHVFDAEPEEVARLLVGEQGAPTVAELARRASDRGRLAALDPPDHLGPVGALPDASLFPAPVARVTRALMAWIADANLARSAAGNGRGIVGVAASPGVYEGRACVLSGPGEFSRLELGDVLVAPVTSPAYNTVLPLLGAVVTDRGGALCHAAIVAREFAIPAVVGTISATRDIPDGAKVRVDGTTGTVTILG
ncbi:MAG: rifampicin phosphotransferase [Acidimicrobiaceae bacterium]|jgi:pyruvate,water dikinase